MPPERRRLFTLLGILGVVTVVAIYRFWPEQTSGAVTRSNTRTSARASGPTTVTAPDVRLRTLGDDRPKPAGDPQRNLFRFKPKAPPPAPARLQPAQTVVPVPTGPPPPPALAPIAMRFIGIVEATEHAQKIAILSDGRGIYQGREGDIIEGRYRILRIGLESIDMVYLDGRGRQTIRLSGS